MARQRKRKTKAESEIEQAEQVLQRLVDLQREELRTRINRLCAILDKRKKTL
jgi:hypothetical protein